MRTKSGVSLLYQSPGCSNRNIGYLIADATVNMRATEVSKSALFGLGSLRQ
jgi:hypothetical protein